MEERALDLHSKALQGLANLIANKDEGNRDEVLAVIILLLYYEVSRFRNMAMEEKNSFRIRLSEAALQRF